jgi:myo-inositol 2-dehydrogenase/D-chiro-inositol 1-dehydrogenase
MAVRMGFIGTGGIAQGHMDRLSRIEGVELVSFCDVNLDRARAAAEKFGGRAYSDFAKMLEGEDLTAVFIGTPPFAHGEIELACCERGLHMLIEKPVAIDCDMARPILKKVKETGVITLVAYKYRWDDHVIKAKEMLAGRTIGLVFGNFWGGLPGAPWWRVQEQSGGQMVEQTTHIVDMARYLAGEIMQVQAFQTRQVMHKKVENCNIADAATANLVFANGAVGQHQQHLHAGGMGPELVPRDGRGLHAQHRRSGAHLELRRGEWRVHEAGGWLPRRGPRLHPCHQDGRPQRHPFRLRGCLSDARCHRRG